MSQSDVIVEIHCQGHIPSGLIRKIPVSCIRLIRKTHDGTRSLVARFFESQTAKITDFCYERSLDPTLGKWIITRSPILPGFEYKLSYTFLEETSEKPIDVFIRPGCKNIDKFVNSLKSLSKEYDPDAAIRKRKTVQMEETLLKNEHAQVYKRRPSFGMRLQDTFTPARQPDRTVPLSAPAKIVLDYGAPKTPIRTTSKDYLSMTMGGRSSSEVSFRRNLSQTLNFDERSSPEKSICPSPKSDFSPTRTPTRGPCFRSSLSKVEISPTKNSPNESPLRPIHSPRTDFSPSKVPPKGGLRNIGNSCYMNACISALAKTTCWIDILLAIPLFAKGSSGADPIELFEDENDETPSILNAFLDVIRNLQSEEHSDGAAAEMAHLRQSLGRYQVQFANRAQQDAHEFLSTLIDKIEEETIAMKLPNNVMTCILSTSENQLCCTNCKYRRSKSEQCWNFSLTLPEVPSEEPRSCPEHGLQELRISKTAENPGRRFWACKSKCSALPFQWGPDPTSEPCSISALISKYFERHSLEYRCESCQCNQAILEPGIAKTPKVLILHLKRFHSDLQTNRCTKRNDTIEVERELDISKYCLDDRIRETGARYRLRSVISHLGQQASNGHYVHDYRDPVSKTWTRFDDSSVRVVSEEHALDEAKTQAYILFYDIDN